jgi:hypothetical protein
MTETENWEVELTKYKGFAWKRGMAIRHVGTPMRVCRVEEDEWLGEKFFILYCFYNDTKPLAEVIVKNETFLDLQDEVTAAYCQMAIASGLWYKGAP